MTYETYSGTAVKTARLVTRFSLKLCQSSVFSGGARFCTAEAERGKKVTLPQANSPRRDVLKLRHSPLSHTLRKMATIVIDWAQWPSSSPLGYSSVKNVFFFLSHYFSVFEVFLFLPSIITCPRDWVTVAQLVGNSRTSSMHDGLRNGKRKHWLSGPFSHWGFQVHSHLPFLPYYT